MQKVDIRFADQGDPTTLVITVPGEISNSGQSLQSFALPLMNRNGGMLLALPSHAIADASLLDAGLQEDDGLLGPSREFSADLVAEDDAGAEVSLGIRQEFIVADFSDLVLTLLREYDPVTDSTEEILGFSTERAETLVAVGDVLPDVTAWLENVVGEQGRLNFYSAREEQEVEVPAIPKTSRKAAAKKITTSQLAEQMASMMAQIQLLASRQEAMSKSHAEASSSAVPVAVQSLGASVAPKLPSLSSGYVEPPSGVVQKAVALVGPCIGGAPTKDESCVRTIDCIRCQGRSLKSSHRTPRPRGNLFGRCSYISAVGSSDIIGGSPGFGRRRSCRPAGEFYYQLREHQRSSKAREDAAGPRKPKQPVLLTGATADFQEASSLEGLPTNGGGAAEVRRQHDELPREARGLSRPEGKWPGNVDVSTRDGLRSPRRFLCNEGVLGASLRSHGPGGAGRPLEHRVHRGVVGRAPWSDVLGKTFKRVELGAALRPPCSAELGGSQPILHQRNRPIDFQENGDEEAESEGGGGCSLKSFPEKTSQVPKKAKGRRPCQTDESVRDKARVEPGKGLSRCSVHDRLQFEASAAFANSLPHVPHKTKIKNRHNPKNKKGSSFAHDAATPAAKHEAVPEVCHMSLPRWCSMLTSNVLRSRCAFSSYLSRSIQLSQGKPTRGPLAPTFFPIPIPVLGCFDRMPANVSSARRHAIHTSRVVNVICMALNFWHGGGRTAPDNLLLRGPSKQHRCLFDRIRSLLRSDGPASIAGAGRRFPELLARISDISTLLTRQGVTSDPYDKTCSGIEVPKDNTKAPELQPYHDLDPSRLKLHGTGSCDPCPYLSDELTMAFREPRSLLVDIPVGPRPGIRDSPATVGALARLWDEQGLLVVHREEVMDEEQIRIFNAHKNQDVDRQIGDRRGRNSLETKLIGPSSCLPSGSDLQDICIDPRSECIFVSITDRKDFYHQLAITPAKSFSVGPPVPITEVESTSAYALFLANQKKTRYSRSRHGDRLGDSGRIERTHVHPRHLQDDEIWVAFGSVLQGDHTGVEVATDSHRSLLETYGLLHPDRRLVANKPLRSTRGCQGLVIDDFFALSVEKIGTAADDSGARYAYDQAQRAYRDAGLLGSPQKDVMASSSGKIIGAFVNAEPSTLARGLCTVGSPPEKRIGLSHLTFEVAKLSHTSDSLHLCLLGAWTSILCYRRPLMALLNHSFRLVDMNAYNSESPKLIPLPRKVVCELVLVATLCPFAVFDLSAGYDDRMYCTDASSEKGAIVSTQAGKRICEIMWKGLRSKGAYTRLLSPSESVLHALGELEPEDRIGELRVDRPLAYHFDFIEIYGGASLISKHLTLRGFVCGPPIEISSSSEYDMNSVWVLEWLSFLISHHRLRAVFLCPPCTTFSIMRRPALRSRFVPFGFNTLHPQTSLGNRLAHRALQLMQIGAVNGVPCVVETPWSSFMKHLPAWKSIASLPVAQFVRCDSCRFGSPHQKGFRFMSVWCELGPVDKRCICKSKHLQIQGVYTKGSAIYTDALAESLALCFVAALNKRKLDTQEEHGLQVKGLENQMVNEVVQSSEWRVDSCWTFRKQSHINILEMASLLRLVQKLSDGCKPIRAIAMVDSHVTQGASSKGRTASLGLGAVLRRVNAQLIAASIFLCVPFCPTRLNPADDPTRNREVRPPSRGLDIHDWDEAEIFDLIALPRTRRWASNWIRLLLRTLGSQALLFSRRNLFRQNRLERTAPPEDSTHDKRDHSTLDFDTTLGYPGEGWYVSPFYLWLLFGLSCIWISTRLSGVRLARVPLSVLFCCPSVSCWPLVLCPLCSVAAPTAMAMPVFPATRGEHQRADARRSLGPIPQGRPVLPATGSLRAKLLDDFLRWTREESLDFAWMLDNHHQCIDEINAVVLRYGRLLYDAGKSYNSYAELINSLTSWKPAIRRMMQGSWDLGYSWKRLEPGEHHVAMPPQILLAMVTTAFLWGWVRFGGCLALGFAGLLRPGEIFKSTRGDLLLPCDVGRTIAYYGMLAIKEPKSRFTNARHQSAKIDIPDLLQVCEIAFGQLAPLQKLWPQSGQTFRARFKTILEALALPSSPQREMRILDPGSLRAGGATYIIQTTESGELCRRRGRWANYKMMEIYVQELSSLLYMQKISVLASHKVLEVSQAFLPVLRRSKELSDASIPISAWRFLFSSWKRPLVAREKRTGKHSLLVMPTSLWSSSRRSFVCCLHGIGPLRWQTSCGRNQTVGGKSAGTDDILSVTGLFLLKLPNPVIPTHQLENIPYWSCLLPCGPLHEDPLCVAFMALAH